MAGRFPHRAMAVGGRPSASKSSQYPFSALTRKVGQTLQLKSSGALTLIKV